MAADSKLTRIGVFYDGNFFSHVSNYYHYSHDRKARISVAGLHEFIRHQVADSEGSDVKYCQIVDSHYFRGRPKAFEAEQRGVLLRERAFDDVLVREGVVTHYLPLGPEGEKGIDVWLALEAYELAIYKRFDVSVLVACDGDFLPLVRKLNTLGTRVMLTAWDFEWTDRNQQQRTTRTAQVLLDEVSYPVMMHQIVEDRSRRNDPLINGLFIPRKELKAVLAAANIAPVLPTAAPAAAVGVGPASADILSGTIQSLKAGFGFIRPGIGGTTIFFFHAELMNFDFNELQEGDKVRYKLGRNDRGTCAVEIVVLKETPAPVLSGMPRASCN
ncbi:MAG TPA: NYN domain-containing protein [Candidatus Acidoferrales bacterium]|jgi:cold shock CspA family protein|nr:NYN domain-containing protein [Candidatus Acidoferrales bacterium]